MAQTVKQLKDYLSTFSDSDVVYSMLATKDDVDIYFAEGQVISDANWESFCDAFDGNWEYAYETLSEIMDSKYSCHDCGSFDYRCLEVDGNDTCPNCGEAEDEICI
jgi:hypothetical protein